MAFKNGLSERLDELRFPSPRSPPSESAFPGYNSLSPGSSNFGSAFSRPSNDVRANLQRRFTTDSSKFSSSWNYLNQGASQMHDPLDLLSSFEKKRQHIEYMREQKRRFEDDMRLLDMQHEKEKIEMDQLARDLAKAGLQGPVSEPTTPPEYRETPVTTAPVTRPTRFSTSSVTSAPGFFNAFAPSATLTSPPQAPSQGQQSSQPTDHFVGHSLPSSRRNSEKEDFLIEPASTLRTGTSVHRYSLPSGNYNAPFRPQASGYNAGPAIDSFAATKHLFHSDNEKPVMKDEDRMSTPDIKGIITMTEPDDKFPTLFRRSGSNMLSANPDAHDLAHGRTPVAQSHSYHNRHRSTHQSMPQNLGVMRFDQMSTPTYDDRGNVTQSRHHVRHSLEGGPILPERDSEAMTPVPSNRPTSLQSSYSTNDLPTVKGNHGTDNAITPPQTHAEHLHKHNASMGRIPASAVSRPTTKGSSDSDNSNNSQSAQTVQGAAIPFGPQVTSVAPTNVTIAQTPMPFPFYPYGVQAFTGQPVHAANNQLPAIPPVNTYGNYNYGAGYRYHENTGRSGVGQRRQTEGDVPHPPPPRFGNYPLENYKNELYALCKDQHGCRYLQRKLEERNPDYVQLIFSETYMHVIELMTDPFGNYLCQKLLEYSDDDQRTVLINNAAPQLVRIALNQHGTRALQKMIEFISTPEQITTVINALRDHVVELVQDLNGNHVIQKCLNRLHDEQAEFIYEAVGSNCVRVGTHRHGCCVLQRCIDHASGAQKVRLISQITENSYSLVQDPFGNYVVQYILDLGEARFTTPICANFAGNIPGLSKQKFSSNVIEKCLRTADGPARRAMVDEMLSGNELEKMLRDSYANYVVQTAMEFADGGTRRRIIDHIRPILPSIRQTPHGRRIAGKILAAEAAGRNYHGHNDMGNSPQLAKNLARKPMVYSGPAASYGMTTQALPPTPAMSSSNTPPGGSYTTTPPAGYTTTPPSGVDGSNSPEEGNGASAMFGTGDQFYTYY